MTKKLLVPVLLLLLLLQGGAPAAEPLNWPEGDVEDLLKLVQSVSGKRFVYDPALLKGKKVTILTSDFPRENLLQLFESVLEMQTPPLGLAASGDDKGEYFKIVPAAGLKQQPLPIYSGKEIEGIPRTERLVTVVVPIKNVDPNQVSLILQDLMHGHGSFKPIPKTGVAVLTEYASNLPRLLKILEVIEKENQPPRTQVFPLKFATSSELAPKLNQLLMALSLSGSKNTGGGGAQPTLLVTDDPRTNSVIVIGNEADQMTATGIITQLDKDLGADQNGIQFFPLQNRNAEDVVAVLKQMYTEAQDAARAAVQPGLPPRPAGVPQPPGAGGSLESSRDLVPRVVADKETNSIIAIGQPRAFKELKSMIEKLDTRRPQVFLEATLLEVGENSTRQLGVQLAAIGHRDGKDIILGTNFGFTQPTSGSTDPAEQTLIPSAGLNWILRDSQHLPFVLRALQTNDDADVIATPSLMTNDNQKASVVISDQQPTTTTQTGTATTQNTFGGYQSADTSLEITPHISMAPGPDGKPHPYLRLEVLQKLEKFVGAGSNGVPPAKESRTTTTTVTLADGATVVISGFTRKDQSITVQKVPLLGDIPLLGFLFRNKNTTEVRRNVFLFITPHIITDLGEMEALGRSLTTPEAVEERERKLRALYLKPKPEAQEPKAEAPGPKPAAE